LPPISKKEIKGRARRWRNRVFAMAESRKVGVPGDKLQEAGECFTTTSLQGPTEQSRGKRKKEDGVKGGSRFFTISREKGSVAGRGANGNWNQKTGVR